MLTFDRPHFSASFKARGDSVTTFWTMLCNRKHYGTASRKLPARRFDTPCNLAKGCGWWDTNLSLIWLPGVGFNDYSSGLQLRR